MIPKSPSKSPEYFAMIKENGHYVDACLEKIDKWRKWTAARGLSELWRSKLSNYYGSSGDGYSSQRVISGGSEGELSNIKVNDLHSLVQNQLIVVTAARPTGIARAINSDVKTVKDSRIGTALAEYYLTQGGWEQTFVNAAEMALLIDEAFLEVCWDKDAGDEVRPDVDEATGQLIECGKPIMSGDAKLRLHAPYNVARDYDCKASDQKWHIVSIPMNRFDLAATFPKFADEILMAAQDEVSQLKIQIKECEDSVYLHLVLHDRTPAVPGGRYSMIVGRTLVADMELPFPTYPMEKMASADVIEGPTGYCASNDVMAMEQVTDALHSVVTTNNITFGGQSIVGPPLAGVTVSEIAKGLRYFELPPEQADKIIPLQLTRSAPETYQYITTLNAKKQEALGSVSGALQAQAMQGASGSSMALIQSQAVQANSGTQRAYFRALSKIMTKTIELLRVYADTPRVIRIVGKAKSEGLKEFKYTRNELNSISTITYEIVNPVSQTIGGRMQMAQDLISNGMITNAKQYLTVATTGNLDVLTEPDEDANIMILEENERLSEGEEVMAVITENHQEHIKGHKSVISSPEAKKDVDLVQSVLSHIQEHINLWQEASMNNPAILMATGQQPLPQVAPPMPPQGPQGGPAPEAKPQAPNEQLEENQPNMPQLPINPATGERAEVPGVQN
jgi:hypothetical protein